MGGGWLAHHPYDHYLFSQDKEFLKNRAYPLMKGAAVFLLDFLKPIPAGLPNAGKLVKRCAWLLAVIFNCKNGFRCKFRFNFLIYLIIFKPK